MTARTILRRWLPMTHRAKSPRPVAAKLGFLQLEDRAVPATLVVTDPTDAGGTGTLRAKIMAATDGDIINYLPGLTGTTTLASNLPPIAKSITINGPGSAILLNAATFKAFDVNDGVIGVASTVTITDFHVQGGAVNSVASNTGENLTLRRMTFNNNSATKGGAVSNTVGNLFIEDGFFINNNATSEGGAVDITDGAVTIERTRFNSNSAVGDGGAIFQAGGALTVRGSSFEGNKTTAGDGGAFHLEGATATATLETSSITNNSAFNTGGGIVVENTAPTVTLRNVTLSGNMAQGDGGGVFAGLGTVNILNSTVAFNQSDSNANGAGSGGGLFVAAAALVTLTSTLVGDNTKGTATDPDVSGALQAASSFNLVADKTGLVGITNGNQGNQVGAGTPLPTGLLPLEATGIGFIHPLANNSLAKDTGTNPAPLAPTDGRGGPFIRSGGAATDVGAFEAQPDVALIVTTEADENDATFDKTDLSLREALRFAGVGAPTITFDAALSGKTITLSQGPLFVSAAVAIVGPGADKLTVDANGKDTAILIADLRPGAITPIQVSLTGLTVANGASGAGSLIGLGGGIVSTETVTLDAVTLSGNKSTAIGGGVLVIGGNLTIRNSTVVGNSSDGIGGGIATTGGNLVIANSTIAANTAKGDGGGVFFNFAGSLTIKNSTLAGNTADSDNAGADKGGGVRIIAGTAEFVSSIFGDNLVGTTGSEPDISGTAKVNFSLIENATGFVAAAGTNAASNKTGDAKLGALLANGGTTKTLLPAFDSIVVNAGDNPDALTTDQRGTGFPRVVGTAADIGAVEFNPNTPPTISDIADTATATATAKTINFTVADAETAPAALTLSYTSDNATLVPAAGAVTFGGTDGNKTLTVTPAAAQNGTATITVTVADGQGGTASDTFVLTVSAVVNQPPTISDILDTSTLTATAKTINFTVNDAETAPAALTLSYTSSNATLVPAVGAVTFGGTDGNKTLTVTPAAGQNGAATITVTVADGSGGTATDMFVLTVSATPTDTTPPTINPIVIPNVVSVVGSAIAPVQIQVADDVSAPGNVTVTAASGKATLVNVAVTGSAGTRTITFTPVAAQTGAATITVTAKDEANNVTTSTFTVTINPVGTDTVGPTFTPATFGNVVATSGQAIAPVTLAVADNVSAAANITVSATSSNTALVAVVASGTGTNRSLSLAPVAGQTGTATISVVATDESGNASTKTFTVTVNAGGGGTAVLIGSKEFAAGSDAGASTVTLFDPNRSPRFTIDPFPGSTGGVRTASADFNGDGIADLVVGTGPGRSTQVRVLDGKTQAVLFSVDPFEATFRGGVYVAAGDLNGDGRADLVITPDEGGGPRADVYSGNGFAKLASFFGIDDPNFRGGARASVADVNGDGTADLLVAAGFGGGPRLATFDGKSLGGTPTRLFGDFFVFEQTLRNGVFIAGGDINGDGFADVIAGGGPGGEPRVFALSGKDLLNNNTQTQLANFFGGDSNSRGGIRVAVKNLDNDARGDIVVGAGAGSGSNVTAYPGAGIGANGTPAVSFDFAFIPGFNGGVFVG